MHRPRLAVRAAAVLSGAALVALAAPASAQATTHLPDDPHVDKQWALTKIQAPQAWTTSTGKGAVIAVVDTGVDLGHPDLAANLVSAGADLVEPEGTCTGGRQSRTCTQDHAQDANGHGTHVAGIAAAVTGNGVGMAGVAPDAKILPVRVLDADGSGTTDQVAAGIRYAADQGADVINVSLGFLSGLGEVVKLVGELDPVYDAVAYAHGKSAVVVVAAGNDAVPLCAEPAAAPGVVCVGSTDSRDLRSWFSNSDATSQHDYLVAPGGDAATCAGDIFSTYLRSLEVSSCSPGEGYEALAGTSMAAPHVAGVAALLAAKGLDRDEIITCLLGTSDDLGTPGRDAVFGHGRVNAAEAVTCDAATAAVQVTKDKPGRGRR